MPGKEILLKNLVNARLLKKYASWIYCDNCQKTVGYLCYVTYDYFKYEFECKCGNKGLVEIRFADSVEPIINGGSLELVKNRFCCPEDNSPLFTAVEKNINKYSYNLVCRNCKKDYRDKRSVR